MKKWHSLSAKEKPSEAGRRYTSSSALTLLRTLLKGFPLKCPSLRQTTKEFEVDPLALALSKQFGGVWGEHPQYPVNKWREAINQDATRLGYWEWVKAEMDSNRPAPVEHVASTPRPGDLVRHIIRHAEKHYGDNQSVQRYCRNLDAALIARPVNTEHVRTALIALASALDDLPKAQPLVDAIDSLLGLMRQKK